MQPQSAILFLYVNVLERGAARAVAYLHGCNFAVCNMNIRAHEYAIPIQNAVARHRVAIDN